MRLPLRRKMRRDSPALCAQEFRVPNQTRKEPRFLDGTPENPQEHCHKTRRTLTVTSGMQYRLVYPKSTQHEAHFPCIGSIANARSTSYTTSGLTSEGKSRDALRQPSQIEWNIKLSKATVGKLHAPHIIWN